MSQHKLFLAICLWAAFATSSFAQVGKELDLWKWTESAPHHQAIVQVNAGNGCGTGIVIRVERDKPIKDGYEGYCLTAYHVVQGIKDNSIKVKFRNGRTSKGCQVVLKDKERDVALVWAWIPGDIQPAAVATESVKPGEYLEFAGLGGGSNLKALRHFHGVASSPSGMEKIFADVPLLPGDSGGPVFNARHEVVGIISGGWFWYDGGVQTANGSDIKATWPARASNVEPIRVLIAEVDDGTKKF